MVTLFKVVVNDAGGNGAAAWTTLQNKLRILKVYRIYVLTDTSLIFGWKHMYKIVIRCYLCDTRSSLL